MTDDGRSDAQRRLRHWNRAFNPVVVVAAILPLGPLADGAATSGPGVVIAFCSWVVFAVDFGVRTRLDRGFPRSWKAKLYLIIVVVTFPIYVLVPAMEETDLLAVSRLGWIAVLALSGVESVRETRLLVRRVGYAGLCAATAVIVTALLVHRVEDADDGFVTFGDSLWWAVATITTVGYGDRVPTTAAGRMAAALLMAAGLALLGVIAASLAAYFGLDEPDRRPEPEVSPDRRLDDLIDEVRALRAEVARVVDSVDGRSPPAADGRAPTPGERQDPQTDDP